MLCFGEETPEAQGNTARSTQVAVFYLNTIMFIGAIRRRRRAFRGSVGSRTFGGPPIAVEFHFFTRFAVGDAPSATRSVPAHTAAHRVV